MIQRTIGIILVLAIISVAGYDTYQYVQAEQRLRETTWEIARWAGDNGVTMSQQSAAQQVVALAAPKNVVVTRYEQTENGARVWTETEVPDTIVAGIIANIAAGKSFEQAKTSPFIIRDYREAGFQ